MARREHLPYVVSTHGSLIIRYHPKKYPKKWLYLNLIEGKNLRRASAIHFTTELEREQSDPLGHKAPSFIVPNGVDVTEFNHLPDKNLSRKEHCLPLDAFVILYFGRLEPRKGLDILVNAFAKILPAFGDQIRLILAGPDFGQQAFLEGLVYSLGISDKVIFPGFVPPDKRNSFLVCADIMALVSFPGENFGISALEGMLAGLPVLVSDNVGFYKDILAEGGGVVVSPNVESVARGMSQMLSDKGNLRSMGKAATQSAHRRYDSNIVAKMMLFAYQDVLTGHRSTELSWA
jgi:glycosyltransferase involved in cell wall biosynthesis